MTAKNTSTEQSSSTQTSTQSSTQAGTLILVATPIGNLGDISARAVEVLSSVQVIGCEDTRRTGRLLEHLGIKRTNGSPRLLLVNETTEPTAIQQVLKLLQENVDVALVSDAGTPGIADPGTLLVAAAAAAGYQVTIVPGASAAVAALAVSGLLPLPHVMEGWLPRKGQARRSRIAQIAAEPRTVVLLESPLRVADTLAELAAAAAERASTAERASATDRAPTDRAPADRDCVVVRELTKLHEEVVRSTLTQMAERFAAPASEVVPANKAAPTKKDPTKKDPVPTQKGEFVIVLGPLPPVDITDAQICSHLQSALDAGEKRRSAIDQVAQQLSQPRNRVYELALQLIPNDG